MKKVKAIGTEFVIPMDSNQSVLSGDACIVKIHDMGEGPFLEVTGRCFDTEDGYSPNSFSLESEGQIDSLAKALKEILRQALPQTKNTGNS